MSNSAKKLIKETNRSGDNLVRASKRSGVKTSNEIFDRAYEESLNVNLDPYGRNQND